MDDGQLPLARGRQLPLTTPGTILLLSLIMTLLIFARPTFRTAFAANHDARQAVATCISKPQAGGGWEPTAPVFRAATARCQGDDAAAHTAWQQLLTEAPGRMPLARAAAPHDVYLARLAVQQQPDRAEAYIWLGDALLEAEQPTEAISAYERALALDPTAALTWRVLGDLYRDYGEDWQSAAHAYDQACHYVDRGKNGCLRAGRLYLDHRLYAEAADRFRQSLRQLPGYPASQRGLAEALLGLGRSAEAKSYLEALATTGDDWARQQLDQLSTDH